MVDFASKTGDIEAVPETGIAPVSQKHIAREAAHAADEVHPANDTLFTSGTLGRDSYTLNSVMERYKDAPVSVEWTIPFGCTFFHIGVHNLPPANAIEIQEQLTRVTARPGRRVAARCVVFSSLSSRCLTCA